MNEEEYKKVAEMAVSKDGYTLNLVRKELRTVQMWEMAIQKEPAIIALLPETHPNFEALLRLAIMTNAESTCSVKKTSPHKWNPGFMCLMLATCPNVLKYMPLYIRNDSNLVTLAVQENGAAIKHATKRVRNLKLVAHTAVEAPLPELRLGDVEDQLPLQFLGEFWNDKDIVLAAVQQNGLSLKYASDKLGEDLQVVMAAVQQHAEALQYASEKFKRDWGVVKEALDRGFKYASDEIRGTLEYVVWAVKIKPDNFAHHSLSKEDQRAFIQTHPGVAAKFLWKLHKSLLEDVNTMRFLLHHGADILPHLIPEKEQDIRTALQICGNGLRYLSERYRADPTFVSIAVCQNGLSLQFATPPVQDNKFVVLQAVQTDARALEFASPVLKDDMDVVIAAMEKAKKMSWPIWRRHPVRYASERLRGDKEVALLAAKSTGCESVAPFFAETLLSKRSVMLAAVKGYGKNLQYASETLRDDKELVLSAVCQDGMALEFASARLQSDPSVAMAAVTQSGRALRYVTCPP